MIRSDDLDLVLDERPAAGEWEVRRDLAEEYAQHSIARLGLGVVGNGGGRLRPPQLGELDDDGEQGPMERAAIVPDPQPDYQGGVLEGGEYELVEWGHERVQTTLYIAAANKHIHLPSAVALVCAAPLPETRHDAGDFDVPVWLFRDGLTPALPTNAGTADLPRLPGDIWHRESNPMVMLAGALLIGMFVWLLGIVAIFATIR